MVKRREERERKGEMLWLWNWVERRERQNCRGVVHQNFWSAISESHLWYILVPEESAGVVIIFPHLLTLSLPSPSASTLHITHHYISNSWHKMCSTNHDNSTCWEGCDGASRQHNRRRGILPVSHLLVWTIKCCKFSFNSMVQVSNFIFHGCAVEVIQ